MRLFPHTWEGLHPAYPKQSNDSESCLSVEQPFQVHSRFVPHGNRYAFMAIAAIVASAAPISPPFRRVTALFAKTTVFATGLGVARSINGELSDRHIVPIFLRSQHSEPPSFPVIDRLSHWDSDNWSVLGGVAGLFVAHRRRRLLRVTRPTWFALHVIAGVGLANVCYAVQAVATLGKQALAYRSTETKQKLFLQKLSYRPEIEREFNLHILGYVQDPVTLLQLGFLKLSSEIVLALKKRQTFHNPHFPNLILDPPNDSDAFHKTYTPQGKAEPVPYAARNYDWSGSLQQGNSTPALEQHIVDLRKRRQQTCEEAESLRAWLYDREVAFYKLKDLPTTNTYELKRQQKYLEVLARYHLATWRAIGECDWMIADATDHLAFMRCTQKGLPWQPTGLPSKSVDLKNMVEGLDAYLKTSYDLLQSIEVKLKQFADAKKTTSKGLNLGDLDEHIAALEPLQKRWEEEVETSRRLLKDASARSKPGSGALVAK
jgi:hypothetical protein